MLGVWSLGEGVSIPRNRELARRLVVRVAGTLTEQIIRPVSNVELHMCQIYCSCSLALDSAREVQRLNRASV